MRKLLIMSAFLAAINCPVQADQERAPAAEPVGASAELAAPVTPLSPARAARTRGAKINMSKVDIRVQDLLLQSFSLLGVNYRFGGKTPETGLDCSGLVRYVFRQSMQMALPHNALAISRIGESVNPTELKPGDLVFFNTLRRQFSHVGIYVGDDLFLHAPSSGGAVQIASMKARYWAQRFNGARRIAPDHRK